MGYKFFRRIYYTLFLVIFILLFTKVSFAVGVQPLVVDLNVEPGEAKEFKLTLLSGNSKEDVKFSLYQPVQLANGSLSYQKPDYQTFSAVNWLKFDHEKTTVYPKKKKTIKGTVKVPFGAGGSHTVIIMVRPQNKQKRGKISFRIQYAVRVNIRVDRAGLRPNAELVNLGLKEGKNKEPFIEARIANPSKLDYLVSGEATIRDDKNRLVERVILKSPGGTKSDSNATRMYPGSKVNYLGKINSRLIPGKYKVRTFFRYADHGQIIKTRKITINKGDFNFPTAKEIGTFSLETKRIDLNLKPGQRKSKVIRLNSEVGKNTKIVVDADGINKEYKHSLLKWLNLRSKKQFDLSGRRKGRAILTIVVPKKVKSGSYHGHIIFKSYDLESKKMLTEKKVPVSVVVGEENNYKIKVRSLKVKKVKEGNLLSLDLYNKSSIFIKPNAEVVIINQQGEFVKKVNLSLPEQVNRVLPLKSQRLTSINKKLKSGEYTAKIVLRHNGKKIKKVEKKFRVE